MESMKEKSIRAMQLEDLKNGISPGTFVIEELNSSFVARKKWEYEEKGEADKKYNELIKDGAHRAFLRKYAKFDF